MKRFFALTIVTLWLICLATGCGTVAETVTETETEEETETHDGGLYYPTRFDVVFSFGGLSIKGGVLYKDAKGESNAATNPYKLVFDSGVVNRSFSFSAFPEINRHGRSPWMRAKQRWVRDSTLFPPVQGRNVTPRENMKEHTRSSRHTIWESFFQIWIKRCRC